MAVGDRILRPMYDVQRGLVEQAGGHYAEEVLLAGPHAPFSGLRPNGTKAAQALTVDATVGGVQFAPWHAETTHVRIQIQTADVRVTFDGSAPTATAGEILPVGYTDIWLAATAAAAKFIRVGGTSAVVYASQMRA